MSSEFDAFSPRVTRGGDGVYRWYYDMDMRRNKSMLYTLLKINLFIFLGVIVFGSLFLMLMHQGPSMIRGVTLIGILLLAGTSVLYVIGFYIFSWAKGGIYRVHFAMGEDEVELVWSARLKDIMDGVAIGARGVRGRTRPSLNEVSHAPFNAVTRMRVYPQWNMLDLSMLGGKFQVYVGHEDFDFVKAFILERLSERARLRSEH